MKHFRDYSDVTIGLLAAGLIVVVALVTIVGMRSCRPGRPQLSSVNPTSVSFDLSPDHAAVLADGVTPMVSAYQLEVTPTSGGPPVSTSDLGKPMPPAGSARVTVQAPALATLPPGDYTAVVSATGPTGRGPSAPSAPFSSVPCPPAAPGEPTVQ